MRKVQNKKINSLSKFLGDQVSPTTRTILADGPERDPPLSKALFHEVPEAPLWIY